MKLIDSHQPPLGQLNQVINKGFAALAATALLGLMFLTVVDVALRKMGMQIAGSFEFIGWLSAMAMGLSLGYVQLHKGHVAITAISERFRGRTAATAEFISSILSLILVVSLTYYTFRLGIIQKASGSLSETSRLLIYPWVFILAAGIGALGLALLADCIRSFTTIIQPKKT
jgi:TRAP-type mannitol/chloroaromatic compound transport system permease small subunit